MDAHDAPARSPARPRVDECGIGRRQLFAGAGLAAASGLLSGCGSSADTRYIPASGSIRHEPRRILRVFDDSVLELGRLLKEAAEIEHDLMVQYLYAAFSLKPRYADLVGQGVPEANTVLGVAIQEMQHLRAVNDLLNDLGFAPVLSRHDFPEEGNIYPFAFKLEPMTRESLAKYVYCEAPHDALTPRSAQDHAFVEKLSDALGADPRPNHIGSLYGSIIAVVGEVASTTDLLPDQDYWLTELHRIKGQGEHDHYLFFRALFESNHPLFRAQSPPGDDVWALAKTDPRFPSLELMADPTAYPGDPRSIGDASTRALAWLGNLTYWLTLALLDLGYRDRSLEARLAGQSLMQGPLVSVARALPLHGTGLPFDALSMGASPGLNRASNLALARRIAREAVATARRHEPHLPADFSIDALEQAFEMLGAWPNDAVLASRG